MRDDIFLLLYGLLIVFSSIGFTLLILESPNNELDKQNKEIYAEIKGGYDTSVSGTYIRELTKYENLNLTKFSNPRTNYSYTIKGDKTIDDLGDDIVNKIKK